MGAPTRGAPTVKGAGTTPTGAGTTPTGAGTTPTGAGTTPTGAGTRPAPTLGEIVGTFKSIATWRYIGSVRNNDWKPFHKKLWQRNYYEHVIRNKKSLDKIRKYIFFNPLAWDWDKNNLSAIIPSCQLL
jgi:hypothetical protein